MTKLFALAAATLAALPAAAGPADLTPGYGLASMTQPKAYEVTTIATETLAAGLTRPKAYEVTTVPPCLTGETLRTDGGCEAPTFASK